MHHWQDIVLAISLFAFNAALIPTIAGKSKPALGTSVVTMVFAVATMVVYVSLSLWYSAAMGAVNASLWATLAVQRGMQREQE